MPDLGDRVAPVIRKGYQGRVRGTVRGTSRTWRPFVTVLAAGVLALCGLTTVAPAAQAAGGYGTWAASGPGTLTVADGTSGPPSLTYHLDPAGLSTTQSWYFYTHQVDPLPGGATVSVPWDYTGNHAFFQVT